MAKDPLSNVGATREAPPKRPNLFWSPRTPERFIGKVDRIDSNRNGDFAVLRGVLVRMPDGRPLRSGEVHVGLSGTMYGRLTPHDSGSWVVINFDGFGKASRDDRNPPRLFTCQVAEGEHVARVRAAALAAHDRLLSEPATAEVEEVEDDLPF